MENILEIIFEVIKIFVLFIVIVIGSTILVDFLPWGRKTKKKKKKVDIEMTPFAHKFNINMEDVITKRRIDAKYEENKTKIKNNEPTNFDNLIDLENSYSKFLKLAELRAKLMSEILGVKVKFWN